MDTQVIVVLLILFFIIVPNVIKIIPEYVRAVVFRLGRYYKTKGPGLIIVIPGIDRIRKIDLRVVTLDVPIQEVITKDNIPIKVNAVCYFRVIQPEKAVINVRDYFEAMSQISQTTLRSVCGQLELDDILAKREEINFKLQQIIDEQTEPWGIKVSIVEIKDVQIPTDMQKAIASQAEAERARRAKIISAEGEFQASKKLSEAAQVISKHPIALQLRFLQTVKEVASEKNSVIFVPLPLDVFKKIID